MGSQLSSYLDCAAVIATNVNWLIDIKGIVSRYKAWLLHNCFISQLKCVLEVMRHVIEWCGA